MFRQFPAFSAIIICGYLIVVSTFSAPARENGDVDYAAAVEDELRHAETYYWFGMAEMGNMAAFAKGNRHLDTAERCVDKGNFSAAETAKYAARMDALRTDLAEQAEIGHDTLYGIFPLFRFFAPSLFADQANTATFELIDDPSVMVTTSATKKLALEAIQSWPRQAQLDVVFISVPRDPALENESLYLFNSSPKFFVHNYREAVDALTPEQLDGFLAGATTPAIKRALLETFQVPELLVVLVRQADVVENDHFYIVEARMFHLHEDFPVFKFAAMGFSRDRRDQLAPIIAAHVLLLIFAYGAFALVAKVRRRAAVRIPWTTYAVVPMLAFAVGRAAPWAIAPILRRFAPIPENLAIVSFWAPMAAGLALIALPMLAYWVLAARLSKLFPPLAFEGRGAAICVAIGAGVVAYLSVPAFLYLEGGAMVVLIGLLLSVSVVAGMLGRSLDSADQFSGGFAVLACCLMMAISATFLLGNANWVWATTAGVILCSASPIIKDLQQTASARVRTRKKHAEALARPSGTADIPPDVERLVERAERPHFQALPHLDESWSHLQQLIDGRSARLAICGGQGTGLTATLDHLVARLQQRCGEADQELIVMRGEASQPVGEVAPYEPFRQALAQHFEVNLLGASEANLQQIDRALGGIFQSVVPFGSILFPDTSGFGTSASRENIFASIGWMFRRLAKTKTVILAIDDAQWFDESSAALLAHLLAEFPAGEQAPIAILVAGHDETSLCNAGFDKPHDLVQLSFPDAGQQIRILTDGIGLNRQTAEEIVQRVGAAMHSTSGLTWLLQVVADLARSNAFVATDEGFAWPGGKWPKAVSLPREMSEIFRQHLRRFPQFRTTLEAAACACEGREFSVQTLAMVLELSRLDLLVQLDTIDDETGIIYDEGARDDAYAFDSAFMLDVARAELKISEAGPETHDVPQIVREYHARLGEVLEKTLKTNSNKLYQVANHYYAAGARHAAKGMCYCLQAANAHCSVVDFEGAQRYLNRAEECAHVLGRSGEIEAHRLLIECQKAHVTGQADERVKVAISGADYLKSHPDAALHLLLAVAQIHYDAGKSTGERDWFDESIRIGREIIARAKSPVDEAMGRHFVGISLPYHLVQERTAELEKALELLEQSDVSEPDEIRLLGRVIGSLAEQLGRGDADQRRLAAQLFQRRLQLIEQSGVGDPQGLAMTHGGLGRLAFFTTPKSIPVAREHFAKDLDVSEAIGDQQGQVQMHSLLGACALEMDEIDTALQHYQASWDLGRDSISRGFAGAGLIACFARQSNAKALSEAARKVLATMREVDISVATDCADSLRHALRRCSKHLMTPDVVALAEYLDVAQSPEERPAS